MASDTAYAQDILNRLLAISGEQTAMLDSGDLDGLDAAQAERETLFDELRAQGLNSTQIDALRTIAEALMDSDRRLIERVRQEKRSISEKLERVRKGSIAVRSYNGR